MDLLDFYLGFPIDDHTGEPLSDDALTAAHYASLVRLQRLVFRFHPSLRELALTNCSNLQRRDYLTARLDGLPDEELRTLVTRELRCEDMWRLELTSCGEDQPEIHGSGPVEGQDVPLHETGPDTHLTILLTLYVRSTPRPCHMKLF